MLDNLRADAHYSAHYFEHAFLAQIMGIALVENQDVLVRDNAVFILTTLGGAQYGRFC